MKTFKIHLPKQEMLKRIISKDIALPKLIILVLSEIKNSTELLDDCKEENDDPLLKKI